MRIDLRAGRAREDALRGIDSVTGTRHADTIIGTNRQNRLAGNGGRDRIVALGGDDHLALDRGTLDAGAGSDHVTLNSGDARARCGPGRDRIDMFGKDALLVDCEALGTFELLDGNVRLHPVTTGLLLSSLGCKCDRCETRPPH